MLKKVDLYEYFFQKMSAYRRDFDETIYMFFFIKKMMNCWKNIMKFRKKVEIVSNKNLIANLYTMKYLSKLK